MNSNTASINTHQRIILFFAGLFGALSVALAAAGAHAFYDRLAAHQQLLTFAKAVDYAMYGALALLAVVALSVLLSSKLLLISGYLLALGTLLFSGSLFLSTLAGIENITKVTPIGGTLLIIAWLSVVIIAILPTGKQQR